MTVDRFTHLHLHTEYSLLDGAIRLKELPDRLKALGMQACAMTDHGVLYGVVDFYTTMVAAGLKPIIGCEVYVAPRGHRDKEPGLDADPAHLILLAENQTGYRNLMKLVSIGFTDGFYYKPRVDLDLLARHHEGLIALSACLSGPLSRAVLNEGLDQAKALALELDRLFGRGCFFLEIQDNGLADQTRVNSALVQISHQTGIPLVATNDCHYLNAEDAYAHEVLLCMQTGKRMQDEDRMRMDSDAFYLKSPQEMAKAFADLPQALENTIQIANRCQVALSFDDTHLPAFSLPPGQTKEAYLEALCLAGLDRRLAVSQAQPRQVYLDRLGHELAVINRMGFTDYFLIVWDFIRFARSQHIMVGPGRGSGAGSLAAFVLGITNIDPLQYGLLFERFLNPDRVSMPDFDIDFCYERRQEVIDYVMDKYGTDHVAQVITFGTLAARACIRDVARALDVPYVETDRLAKMIPAQLGMTLDKALAQNAELRRAYEGGGMVQQVIDLARRFEGMPRHASTHAAGVVISKEPLMEVAPLARNEDAIVVQFDKNNVERIGLLKFDFLGLRTLTVLRDTATQVFENSGIRLDFDQIPMDDASVYAMLADGQTHAVFQLESPGMTAFMKDLRPQNLEDIIAGLSLYRPGPMEQIPRYVAAKQDPAQIRYDHPLLEPILNVTYGCIVYQEQVMQIVRDLAGFSMGQSDKVRRAMSKKKPAELAAYKNLFIHGGVDEQNKQVAGALARGVSLQTAEQMFDEVMAFAGYAFNKSHAAAYALIAYQTAWCKKHHPVEFMAAMLNSYLGNLDQAASYVRVCRQLSIPVLPPDINRSQTRFSTEAGGIRFALAAVKNVGSSAIESLIEERTAKGPFRSFGDFMRRMSERALNRKMIESLIRASALDGFGISRSKMIAVIEPFANQLAARQRLRMDGQLSLFDLAGQSDQDDPEPDYPNVPAFSRSDRLAMEKEVLGLYISGHPLDDHEAAIRKLTTASSLDLQQGGEAADALAPALEDGQAVRMAGMVIKRQNKLTRSNEWMSFVTMEDLLGVFEVLFFPALHSRSQDLLQEGAVLWIAGRLSLREDEQPKLIAEAAGLMTPDMTALPADLAPLPARRQPARHTQPAPTPARQAAGHVRLCIRFYGQPKTAAFDQLMATLSYFQGPTPVRLYLEPGGKTLDLPADRWVSLDDATLKRLADRYGAQNLVLLADPPQAGT